jgi:hypothetical protein
MRPATGHSANKQTSPRRSDEKKEPEKLKMMFVLRFCCSLLAARFFLYSGNQAQIISEFNRVNSSEAERETRRIQLSFVLRSENAFV